MRSLKYLFIRGFRPVRLIISAAVTVAMLVLVMVFHENASSEDYLISKLCLNFGGILSVMIIEIFLCAELTGNRLLRSAPISKEMRTFGIPMFSTLLGLGVSLVSIVPYSVFIAVSGHPASHLSDTLLVSAALLFLYIVMGTIAMNIRYGMILLIYFYFPFGTLWFFISDEQWNNGFGVELPLSVLIFVGTLIVSVAIAFAVSHIFYKKMDFKAYQQAMTASM